MTSRFNLSSPGALRALLRARGLRLQRQWGQHFLCDETVLELIIAAAELDRQETVLEIGAGIGTLTRRLAPEVRRLFAVEIDRRLIALLRENLAPYPNVQIVPADFLKLELENLLPDEPMKALGNLPYGVSAPILRRLVGQRRHFRTAVLLLQFEVAQKLTARPGSRMISALGLWLQAFAQVRLIKKIPPDSFFPAPEVSSALVRLDFLPRPRFSADEQRFGQVVRAAFNLRRKMLRRALQQSPLLKLSAQQAQRALELAEIDPRRRGESLSIEEFDRLACALAQLG